MHDKLLDLQKMTRELLSQINRRLLQTIAPSVTDTSSYEQIYNNSKKKSSKVFDCDLKLLVSVSKTCKQSLKHSLKHSQVRKTLVIQIFHLSEYNQKSKSLFQ